MRPDARFNLANQNRERTRGPQAGSPLGVVVDATGCWIQPGKRTLDELSPKPREWQYLVAAPGSDSV